ncbi:hypothetical protein NDU88_001067 [Pleurodeles waltl]|uniref:Uncharacterized protein n=1 Tax=Pleurodeles waltl TaxID=8319 RepID=A0AAV7MJX0_PLEWA|nr:hypothetical protein NDU88_001067 [Pleurodeles waltl]
MLFIPTGGATDARSSGKNWPSGGSDCARCGSQLRRIRSRRPGLSGQGLGVVRQRWRRLAGVGQENARDVPRQGRLHLGRCRVTQRGQAKAHCCRKRSEQTGLHKAGGAAVWPGVVPLRWLMWRIGRIHNKCKTTAVSTDCGVLAVIGLGLGRGVPGDRQGGAA